MSKVQGVEWIRLHYAYPAQFPYEILDEIRDNPKVCKYLDIPIQHVSDKVLKDMKRNTTKQYTVDLIHKIREVVPNIAIRTTLLTGFPTESQEDFQELVDFIQEMKFDRLGVFTYSHEENTGAYKYEDGITEEEKNRRQQLLMEIQSDISYELNQVKIGQTYKVLIDKIEGGNYIGRSEFDSPEVDNEVIIHTEKHLRLGDFVQAKIIAATEFDLEAELVE